MPRQDGTGPQCFGAQTGRRRGFCINGRFRDNFGYGFHGLLRKADNRAGFRQRKYSETYNESETEVIKNELKYLEQEIKIRKQILSEIDNNG
jgi:hypothetical protein